MENSDWINIEDKMPESDGKYECLIVNDRREFKALRLFKRGHWFGGCRPFSENEKILKWKNN